MTLGTVIFVIFSDQQLANIFTLKIKTMYICII